MEKKEPAFDSHGEATHEKRKIVCFIRGNVLYENLPSAWRESFERHHTDFSSSKEGEKKGGGAVIRLKRCNPGVKSNMSKAQVLKKTE